MDYLPYKIVEMRTFSAMVKSFDFELLTCLDSGRKDLTSQKKHLAWYCLLYISSTS